MAKKQPPGVSDQLRKAIRDSGQTSYALGKAAGMPPIGIDRFLSGERGLTNVSIDKLCRALGLRLTKEGEGDASQT